MNARLFDLDGPEITSDDWYSPAWLFLGMGLSFDLDVAAPVGGPLHVPADRWLTIADDGLTAPWEGLVWCNPPYSEPGPWCQRWAAHPAGGCLLIRSDLSAVGPHVAWAASSSCYVPPGRLRFVHPDHGDSRGVPFTSILLGRGPVVDDAFRRLAALFGGTTRRLS